MLFQMLRLPTEDTTTSGGQTVTTRETRPIGAASEPVASRRDTGERPRRASSSRNRPSLSNHCTPMTCARSSRTQQQRTGVGPQAKAACRSGADDRQQAPPQKRKRKWWRRRGARVEPLAGPVGRNGSLTRWGSKAAGPAGNGWAAFCRMEKQRFWRASAGLRRHHFLPGLWEAGSSEG